MTKIWKIVLAVAFIIIIVLGYIVYKDTTSNNLNFGAVGVKLAENYDPYIRYNGGYNSLLPITTTGPLTITTSNAATSTTSLGCIQTTATSTATPIRFVIGSSGATTTFQGTNSSGVVAWQYGTCPI